MKLSIKTGLLILSGIVFNILVFVFSINPFLSVLVNIFLLILFYILINILILKPILGLNKLSKIISSGNLGTKINIKAIDELGELSQNFHLVINNLTSGLQNMANSLRDEKRKEKELAANYIELDREKAKDEALLSSIGDGIVAVDDMYNISLFNDAAGKIIGIKSTGVIGQPYNFHIRFINEKDQTPAEDFIGLALAGKRFDAAKRIMLQKTDGELLPILLTISPIYNNAKRIRGVVMVIKDITGERELEKLKDEFVSLASHELRTPMTAIKGLVSMIMDGDYGSLNDGLKDPLSDIAKSTDRLIQLVNDMLDVSRIEGGRTKIILTNVSIPLAVREVVNMLKPIADQKQINLEIKESELKMVYADEDKVKQILINLINNAIKFTDHGAVIISFYPRSRYVYTSITDSGIGISKENQQKLFSKFTQITSSQQGRPLGTGLGLYISREFTRIMGGEMWIEQSEEGKGSTFTFALPLA